ncbi:MAG TPA: NAD(P)(+) transhydrogenase (Re/Si-specific) subunit beta [Puia sp.]|nr:NAD(P)(+) transhydrogenase (Re/Si-specific) subunit beta [Puia sp.]
MGIEILSICYIIAAVTFILGLKMLADPATARKGNLIAAAGMAIAVLGTILLYRNGGEPLRHFGWMIAALVIGAVAGTLAARKIRMTAMPEMVSLFNGMGGACAALISILEFGRLTARADNWTHHSLASLLQHLAPGSESIRGELLIILAGLIIGSVSLAGSIVAWAKLNGRIKDFAFKGQHAANILLLAIILAGAVYVLFTAHGPFQEVTDIFSTADTHSNAAPQAVFYGVFVLALLYGIAFVLPIGGADMPVVISLLNSFTGVAAACGGFLYDNKAMLTGGILVGAAGTVLTILMCKAMNRSLRNVLIGSFGGSVGGGAAPTPGQQGSYREISISDAAVLLSYAHKVMIVPGYGLAVAQAQHACHELEKLLTEKGVEVKYAIHPVAGRMPGHMNVLLAEADVGYDNLLELEQANQEFPATDVVMVLGANDVVNPAARTDPSSPIYGMPILDVEQAKNCIVNKRSMKPGYAGIENELFFRPRTSMLFGDAKTVLQKLITEIKNL